MIKLKLLILGACCWVMTACGTTTSRQPIDPQPVLNQSGQSHPVLQTAYELLGTPYRYGGVSPASGFDCSGFVYYTHLQSGLELPRTSVDQFRSTTPVSRQRLKPGDLVFFRTYRGRIDHVGIYIGDNRFIHAPGKGKSITITTLDHPYWEPRFVRGGRTGL